MDAHVAAWAFVRVYLVCLGQSRTSKCKYSDKVPRFSFVYKSLRLTELAEDSENP